MSSGKDIRLKRGRYGAYVEVESDNGKLRRAAVPSQLVADFSLQSAMELLQWPKVAAMSSKFGPNSSDWHSM